MCQHLMIELFRPTLLICLNKENAEVTITFNERRPNERLTYDGIIDTIMPFGINFVCANNAKVTVGSRVRLQEIFRKMHLYLLHFDKSGHKQTHISEVVCFNDVLTTHNAVLRNVRITANAGLVNFTQESNYRLPSMKFDVEHSKGLKRKHGSAVVSSDVEVLQEVNFSNDISKLAHQSWPDDARYYVIRKAWLFCQEDTAEIGYPSTINFNAYWRSETKPFFEIHAIQVNQPFGYKLFVVDEKGKQIGRIKLHDSQGHENVKCNMYACIWDDESKYEKVATENIGSHGPMRPFRIDGCSYEAINQHAKSCWYVAVSLILSKIEPIYKDLSIVPSLKKWLDYDRSMLTNSQTSCVLLPKSVYKHYAFLAILSNGDNQVYKESDFDFPRTGGHVKHLINAVFTYLKEYMLVHLASEDRPLDLKTREKYEKLRIKYRFYTVWNKPITVEFISTFSIPRVYKDNFCITFWDDLELDPSSVLHALKKHPNLLGGILGVVTSIENHAVPFTMCDGSPIVCSWGTCLKDITKKDDEKVNIFQKLRLGHALHIDRMELIFGPDGTQQPKQKKKTVIQMVLRNPMNTVHLHLDINLRQDIDKKSFEKDLFFFKGKVTNIIHEFEESGMKIKGILGSLLNKEIRCAGNLKRNKGLIQYSILQPTGAPIPITFASNKRDPLTGRKTDVATYFLGDISGHLLQIYLLKFIQLNFDDFSVIVELKSNRDYMGFIHDIITKSYTGPLKIGMTVDIIAWISPPTDPNRVYRFVTSAFSGTCTMSVPDHFRLSSTPL